MQVEFGNDADDDADTDDNDTENDTSIDEFVGCGWSLSSQIKFMAAAANLMRTELESAGCDASQAYD